MMFSGKYGGKWASFQDSKYKTRLRGLVESCRPSRLAPVKLIIVFLPATKHSKAHSVIDYCWWWRRSPRHVELNSSSPKSTPLWKVTVWNLKNSTLNGLQLFVAHLIASSEKDCRTGNLQET